MTSNSKRDPRINITLAGQSARTKKMGRRCVGSSDSAFYPRYSWWSPLFCNLWLVVDRDTAFTMSTPTVMRSLFFHRSKHTHLITAFNNNNNNHGIHCISVTRSLTVIQSSQYSTWRSNVWSRSVAELRRVQPRTTVVSRQRMILQRCWNKTIRRDQTYNIAASSSLSYCDLPRQALSSLKTSSSSSLERQQRQKLRKPTFQDVIYFQSILSNPH